MSDAADTPVLLARGLRKEYGKGEGLVRAVDGVDLDIGAGETVAVMGEATNGPDVVASVTRPAELSSLEELASAPSVDGHGGPYPVAPAKLQASGRTSDVQAVWRDTGQASVDQPELIQGRWVSDGGATRAELSELPRGVLKDPGLVWLTAADVRSLAADSGSLSYVMSLKLADPDAAQAFADATLRGVPPLHAGVPGGNPPRGHRAGQRDAKILLMIGAWLLGLLAVANVSALVGGRMADQTRRVGLLKAVGGTPGLVAAVLLAEYVLVAIVAAAAGLAVGSLTAPLLTGSSAGLIGSAGTPSMTMSTAGLVTAVALGVAVVATFVPAMRAARSSTVNALADSARPPRRTGWLIAVSARLPVPLLLALRVAARRPRRVVLGVVGIAITVSGIYVALVLNAFLTAQPLAAGVDDAQAELLRQVLLVVMVVLVSLAAVNAIFITWATVLDYRHSSALARALGATPGEVSAAPAAAQVLPALVGAILGAFPGGFALFHAINTITGGDSNRVTLPPLWQLLALVAGTVLVVAALTAVPARLGGRRPVTETLQAELT